jgi:type I restriction enzyme S subunit
VTWLGAVPANWVVKPGLSVLREKHTRNTGLLERTVLSLSYGKIVIKPLEKIHGLVPASFETYQIVDPGEIIIRPTDLQNDWNSLRVGIARDRGIITSAYLCLKTVPPITPEYGYLLLHTYDLMKIYYGMGSGLRQNLDFTDFKRMPVLIPSEKEQECIVRYLTHTEHRINRLIIKKQRLIKLLEEQKQAIIQSAVTRGLNPNVRLKASGVDWLGAVPEHWEVKRLKYAVPQITVGIVVQPASLYVPKGIPCLRSINISSGKIKDKNLVFISEESNELNRKSIIFKDDIVLVRTGRAGVAVIVTEEYHGANCVDLLVIRKSAQLISKYLLMYLSSYAAKTDVGFNSVGAIQAHYNTSTLANLVLPIPPINEQHLILEKLQLDLEPLNKSMAKVKREVELIREYRIRLIADVVTGKLDVRNIELPMIVDAEELEEIENGEEVEAVKAEETEESADADD